MCATAEQTGVCFARRAYKMASPIPGPPPLAAWRPSHNEGQSGAHRYLLVCQRRAPKRKETRQAGAVVGARRRGARKTLHRARVAMSAAGVRDRQRRLIGGARPRQQEGLSGGFHFPMTLSFFHFVFTIIWYQMLAMGGAYTQPAADQGMPQSEKFKVAAAGFASIGFMNLSLNSNSVGFYQITKLTIIPVTLAINAVAYGVHAPTKIKLALLILLAGVGVATVTDVQLRPIGLIYGALAVATTAVFQIWQGTKQKEFAVSATQLQAGIAPWQSFQALAVSIATECYRYTPEPGGSCDTATSFFESAFGGNERSQRTLWIVLATCFLALAVNLCSFGLIGKTSAITFQVVGHAKTCLVLIGGYVLFPSSDTQQVCPCTHARTPQTALLSLSLSSVLRSR